MPSEQSRITTSQPEDWVLAFKEQSDRNGETLAEFIGDCCRSNLDKDLREGLSERRPAHRPTSD